MPRKADTKRRITQRNYENRNKEKRYNDHKVWGTSLEREFADEIDKFLFENHLTKVELVKEGYKLLQKKVKKAGKSN